MEWLETRFLKKRNDNSTKSVHSTLCVWVFYKKKNFLFLLLCSRRTQKCFFVFCFHSIYTFREKKNDLIRENKQEKKEMIYTHIHSITVINGRILVKIFQDDEPSKKMTNIKIFTTFNFYHKNFVYSLLMLSLEE
jgi:hypothetical protein